MWSKEPGMTKVLFNTLTNDKKYKFIQDMWSHEPGMTKVLFNTLTNNKKY